MALGIMAFALVAVFGLMPLGMSTFKKAMDLSVGSQIAQRVIGDAQQSDFDKLIDPQGATVSSTGAFAKPTRYFDEQGEEGLSTQSGMVYMVNTRVVPSTYVPDAASTSTNGLQNSQLATVTVQVANNPGRVTLTPDTATALWNPTGAVPMASFSTFIARSSSPASAAATP